MINYDKLRELQRMAGHSEYAERIIAQLNFACNLTAALDGRYDEYIAKALDILLADIEENGVITKNGSMYCEQALLHLKDTAKEYTIHCVAHAHIDMNWMWGYQETVSVTVDTFRTILDLMNEYPDFTFAQSQASTYEIIEKYAPSMLEEIKQRVKEGRWEVSASTWVETDKNMPNGESLARHILYTKRYLSSLLDIEPDSLQLDFEPDTFGHNANVPEICTAGGVKYYYHCRGSSHEHDAYIWQGDNGSRLLVFRDPHWYSEEIHANSFRETPMICKRDGISSLLCVYGVGDHGGGPTRRDIERLIKMSSWPIMPRIKFSSYKAFFAELEKIKSSLPVLTGERNFIFDGCYTSQAKIKMTNRISEDRMFESESIASMSLIVGGDNFAESFKKAYKKILFNHFHDILPGSGTVETREHALGTFQDSMAAISTNANLAMREIAKNIDTSLIELEKDDKSVSEGGGTGFGVAHDLHYKLPSSERGMGKKRLFHIFNPTEYSFDGITDITVFDWNYNGGRAFFTDDKGNEITHELVEDGKHYWGHGYKKFALKVKIPPFGYCSYILDLKPAGGDGPAGLPYLRNDNYTGDDIILENDIIKAEFDHMTMELKRLTDKRTDKQLISSPSCIFNLITENTIHGMTSWRIGDYMNVTNLNKGGNVKVYSIKNSGLRKQISYSFDFAKRSDIDITVTLDDNDCMLKYDIKVNFHETGNGEDGIPQLSFAMPFDYSSEKCRFDIPFGTVDRGVYDFDVPANSFAAPIPVVGDTGLMLISDSKYGFRYTENKLTLSLIRASFDPDPYPEYGVHYIRVGVGVCGIQDNNTELYKNASKFIHSLPFCTANLATRKGKLALNKKFIDFEGNIKLSAIKPAEDVDGMVIRFYTPGKQTANYKLCFADRIKEAYYTDINETSFTVADFKDNSLSGKCNPSQIITVLVKF